MQIAKTIIIVSTQVDATIREYQPDVEFQIFKSLEELGNYLDRTPIRAKTLYFTEDVVGAVNSSFSFLKNLVTNNDYLNVDEVVYLSSEDAPELASLKYLIDENGLDNWIIVTGTMTRSFITEVINGTFRDEQLRVKYKAVYRRPRADYIKSQLRHHDSLEEDYVTDEQYLSEVPDEPIPELVLSTEVDKLKRVFIAGEDNLERTAFAFLAAQYIALNHKVLIVESDPEYHKFTELVTKSGVVAKFVDIDMFYNNPVEVLEEIRNCEENLVIFQCINRYMFNYNFLVNTLYYNLGYDFDYIIVESKVDEVPYNTNFICTIQSTVLDCLKIGENFDRVLLPYTSFVGINLASLPDIRINSGTVMGTILADLLSTTDIPCPVLTITSLKLNAQAYDLGAIFKGVIV